MSWYARELHGLPDDWQWCQAEAGLPNDPQANVPPGMLRLKGAVYRAVSRGKRKGRPIYKDKVAGTERSVFFASVAMNRWIAEVWEPREGKCSDCFGTGQQDGPYLQPCSRCKATGKPSPAPVESRP